MNPVDFFKEPKPHSIPKMEIAARYFAKWASILKPWAQGDLTYLDLYSGPGVYDDDTLGTPLRILNAIERDSDLVDCIRIVFYEKHKILYERLVTNVNNHPVTKKIKHTITFEKKEVGKAILPRIEARDCTFCFIDPCGFKGVSMDLLNKVTRGWGCDCLFFLSTSGIRRNIERGDLTVDLTELFGAAGLSHLKKVVQRTNKDKEFRDELLGVLKRGLAHQGLEYFIPFRVLEDQSEATSHYLVFVTKHPSGFEAMKEVMEDQSVLDGEGLPLYYWREDDLPQLELGEIMSGLCEQLLDLFPVGDYNAKQMIKKCHVVGVMYTKRCIVKAIHQLRIEGKVRIDGAPRHWIRNGQPALGDNRTVTFL